MITFSLEQILKLENLLKQYTIHGVITLGGGLMKRIAMILCLVIVVGLVVSCGGNNNPKTTNINTSDKNTATTQKTTDTNNQQKRELEEAKDQPLLWASYENFLKIEKVMSPTESLSSNSGIMNLWKTIESERVTWGQNPFPALTPEAIDEVYDTYIIAPTGVETQIAINALLYRGAELSILEDLHALKDDKPAFKNKFIQIFGK